MPILVKQGRTMTVADGVVPYWRAQGWQLDLDGDGIPDATGGGQSGRSITTTQVIGGRLTVTYDDGSTQDAGPIPGLIVVDTDGVPYVPGV